MSALGTNASALTPDTVSRMARPKTQGPARTMRFDQDVDDFIVERALCAGVNPQVHVRNTMTMLARQQMGRAAPINEFGQFEPMVAHPIPRGETEVVVGRTRRPIVARPKSVR